MHKVLRKHAENQLKNDFLPRLGRNAFAPPGIGHVIGRLDVATTNACRVVESACIYWRNEWACENCPSWYVRGYCLRAFVPMQPSGRATLIIAPAAWRWPNRWKTARSCCLPRPKPRGPITFT